MLIQKRNKILDSNLFLTTKLKNKIDRIDNLLDKIEMKLNQKYHDEKQKQIELAKKLVDENKEFIIMLSKS